MFDFSDSLLPPPLLSGSHICFRPSFAFRTTFVSLPHLSFRRLLIRSIHPPILRSFRTTPTFVFQQSSFSSNLRLRIFHALVPHNLVYPELFFVPMSISTVVQIPIQSAILQSVTHIISQTDRCSSPCFFMGVSIIKCRLNTT